MMSPVPAVDYLLEALGVSPIVAVGEVHWLGEQHTMLQALARRLPGRAGAVVVEFAAAVHQPVLDAFVSGASVDRRALAAVTRDTLGVGAWDSPVYQQFLEAVREANVGCASQDRVRVVAGDRGAQWLEVHALEDLKGLGGAARDGFLAKQV
jgi:uncharacterized iron-regulated protein